jgi:hypothetical protein
MYNCELVANWLPQHNTAVSLPATPAEYITDWVITLYVTGHCFELVVCKYASVRVGRRRINAKYDVVTWWTSPVGKLSKILLYTHVYERFTGVRFIIVFTQLGVTVPTNFRASTRCMNERCVVGHKRESSHMFRCIVISLWMVIYCGYMKCCVLYKLNGLRLTICACCSWEKALNFCFDASFSEIYRAEIEYERNNTKFHVTNYETSRWIANGW